MVNYPASPALVLEKSPTCAMVDLYSIPFAHSQQEDRHKAVFLF